MSEYLSGGQGTLEQFVRAAEESQLFVTKPNVQVRSKGYIAGVPGYSRAGYYIGRMYIPGSYVSRIPSQSWNKVKKMELPIADGISVFTEDPTSSSFELRFRLQIGVASASSVGRLVGLATGYDEEVKRSFYCNPDGEEIDEDEYLERSEFNDEYYEDEEILGKKTNFRLHFAPVVSTPQGTFEAAFNIPEDDMKDTLTLFLPTGPVPFEAIRGTDVLQSLKKSVGNNNPEQDEVSLRAWFDMAKSPSVPPQTRLVVALAIEEYKQKFPQAEGLLG